MSETIYNPVLDALADHKAITIGKLHEVVKGNGATLQQVVQAVMVLTGAGHLASVQDESIGAKARKCTDKLNQFLLDKARSSNEHNYLASPATGGGISVNRFQQLFLLALHQGKKESTEWAQFAWQILGAQGQKLIKERKTLETPGENLAELAEQAKTFQEKQLPILKSLLIV